MIANPTYRRLAAWVLWALFLVFAIGLLTHPVIDVSESVAIKLAIACIWAATVLPNVLRPWTHPAEREDSSTLRRQRTRAVWRRSLAIGCGALGAVAMLVFRQPLEAGGIPWLDVLQASACVALVGYGIGDRVLPDLLAQWGSGGGA